MASFEQNNKKWSVRFRYVEFGVMKNKRLSGFSTKKEAQEAYSKFITTHTATKKSDYSSLTFYQIYQKYLDYIKDRVKVSTFYDIHKVFDKHLLPVFGDKKIFKITNKDIFNWQKDMNNTKYSYKYKAKMRTYISGVFRFATLYYELPTNPVTNTEAFKRIAPKKEIEIWSKEEFSQFISVVDSLEYKVFFTFLYLTGCRKGEALSLTWDKINFNKKTVLINCTLTIKVFDKPYAIVSTKTGENRTLLMPDTLIDILLKLKNSRTSSNNSAFVFGDNKPLAETSVTRIFNKYIELSKVKKIHIHCLRHSHVSLLIANGENIVMIAKRMGHSSIEQTLNTYSHLMPNAETEMISKLNLAF